MYRKLILSIIIILSLFSLSAASAMDMNDINPSDLTKDSSVSILESDGLSINDGGSYDANINSNMKSDSSSNSNSVLWGGQIVI